jgi:hypothetical protein
MAMPVYGLRSGFNDVNFKDGILFFSTFSSSPFFKNLTEGFTSKLFAFSTIFGLLILEDTSVDCSGVGLEHGVYVGNIGFGFFITLARFLCSWNILVGLLSASPYISGPPSD